MQIVFGPYFRTGFSFLRGLYIFVMKLGDRILSGLRLTVIPAVAVLAFVLGSCDSVIYDYEGDCNYYIHFKYDYNMKWADAFSHEVRGLSLYVMDKDGKVVLHKTESGEALAREGYSMQLDIEPGEYDFIVWAGVGKPVSFSIPDTDIKTELTATLARTHEPDGSAHIYNEVDRLYYGYLEDVTLGTDQYHFTMPLMKDTNNIRVILQHLSGEPVPEDQFTYTITDSNGSLDWDNSVLDDETITYHAWHVGSGTAVTGAGNPMQSIGTRAQSTFSTALAEFTVSRLMTDHAPDTRLVVSRAVDGEAIIDINLIDALLLVKGYYNRGLSDQEYLDRNDEYSLTFFLDEGFRWMNSYIYINSWRVVLQDTSL